MLNNVICVFDFETGGLNRQTCEVIQVAALALNPRNLTTLGEFESLMRPLRENDLETDALKANKKTLEELREAPHPQEVWGRFAQWCARWALRGKNDWNGAPIAAGHNILKFDLPILDRYCKEYGPTWTEKSGEVIPGLFSTRKVYDTCSMLGDWFESLTEPRSLRMDFLRKYFAMPRESVENAHDALQDVRDTAAILVKLLGLYRQKAPTVIWKDCFDEAKVKAELARRKAAKEKVRARTTASNRSH